MSSIPRPANTNVLAGLACPNPECRSVGPFRIQAEALFEVSDDGASEFTELDFRADSFMACVACGDEGSVAHFRVFEDLTQDVVLVSADGCVQFVSVHEPRMRTTEIDLLLSDVAERVPTRELPKLPATHVAFVRRRDPDVDRQATRELNRRVNDAFGGVLRGPVALVRRTFLSDLGADV